MRPPHTLTYTAAAAAAAGTGFIGGTVVYAADPRIVQIDRSYYAYGYEGDATPNG